MNSIPLAWAAPPARLSLSRAMVHVWRAALDPPISQVRDLLPILSDDEQARAQHFCFEQDRRRFIAGRGILRMILSRYADIPPGRLCFRYGPQGKPALAPTAGLAPLAFNVAHSRELALYAVAWRRAIGIDLEAIQPLEDVDQIAERFFSVDEQRQLCAVP